MSWYAIYTTPRSEKIVAERLKIFSDVEVYLPLIDVKRIWSDRVKIVSVPLLSSYVFVNAKEHLLRDMLQTVGVVRVIYYDKKPAVILDKEIQQIKRFIELSGTCEFVIGDEVEILTGGLKSISGKVQKIGKTHIYLYLEQLGAKVCVKTDNIKKIGGINTKNN